MTETADANLVAAALKGDADSFSRLCERYYPALVAIAYARLSDRDLAEDAAQEALLTAFRDITRVKKPERFAGWLAAICRNIALDMARFGVTSNCIGPFAWSRMTSSIPVKSDEDKERVDRIKSMSAEKIAPVVIALASDQAQGTWNFKSN